uniref:Major facilitator superfamily (MFS) profile domain-containing protein n=1 Tax=Vitrella brassicaformis TaxID=1169539 RepID=A0A7S1P738_9ALVE|mmetsp:Transcript_37591/g.94293  ORF Transcript_37591/g.94293 Transcript_37591/m.94293 type:complete len:233 (+) Transcript_37591:986-1684(+)
MAFGAALKTVVATYNTGHGEIAYSPDMAQQIYIISEVVGRLGGGILSDVLEPFMGRCLFISIALSFFVIGQLGLALLAEAFVWPMVVCMGIAYAACNAATPAYVRNNFDVRQFGFISSIAYSTQIPSNMFFTRFVAHFLDKNKKPGADFCRGHKCNSTWTVFGAAIGCIPVVFGIILAFFEKRPKIATVKTDPRRSSLVVPDYNPHLDTDEDIADELTREGDDSETAPLKQP